MAKNPVFPLYYNDMDRATRDWTDEEFGCYMRLLMHQWAQGEIPKETQRLARIANTVEKNWSLLKPKFSETGTGLQNTRLEEIRKEREAFSKKQSENGKNGGRPTGSTKKKSVSQDVHDWNEMIQFFNNSCLNCGYQFPDNERPTKDHIVAQKNGGVDHITNFQPLCRECNSSKWADHSTDYRLKFIDSIPENLKEKWFKKPKINPKESLHNEEEEEEEGEEEKRRREEFGKSENLLNGTQIVPTLCRIWYNKFPHYTKDQDQDFKAVGSILQFMCRQHSITDFQAERELIESTFDQVAETVSKDPFWANKPLKSIGNNIQEFYNKIKNGVTEGKQQSGSGNLRADITERIKARFAEGQPG